MDTDPPNIQHCDPGPEDEKPSWKDILFNGSNKQPIPDYWIEGRGTVPGCYRITKGARYS